MRHERLWAHEVLRSNNRLAANSTNSTDNLDGSTATLKFCGIRINRLLNASELDDFGEMRKLVIAVRA